MTPLVFNAFGQALVSLLIVASLLCAFTMLGSRYLKNHIYAFAGQAWLIAGISLMLAIHFVSTAFYAESVIYALLRGIALPFLFYLILKRHLNQREKNTWLQAASGLLVSMLLVMFSAIVSTHMTQFLKISGPLTSLSLTATLSIVLIGFLMLITRNEALSKLIALLMIENGLIIGGLMLVRDSNVLIALIVIFDVLIAVVSFHVLSGYLIEQINETDNTKLNKLVG